MSVAANTGDALESEIEELSFEAGLGEEGDEEGSKTAVDVKPELLAESEFGESNNVVDDTVGEVGCGTDEEYRVGVDETGDGTNIYLVSWCGTSDHVNLDAKVFSSFVERSVSRLGENPNRVS